MKYLLCLVALICLSTYSLKAQTLYSIRGIVTDTAVNINLANTSISVLNSKDSILVKFTRANAEGAFSIENLKPGKFILLVTYPKYADYVEHFTLDSAKRSIDFGKISLLLKSKLLADVIIKGKVAAIKMKADTTEYNAGSFKIEPNSKVEDLLRQLPGIQVDKDGKITAQGETVSKVLVDGEEFFGDDPTLVTKNIRGDMVDKVQLYDKKSDQAAFTGIDDGVKTKTINIKLKEDSKKGFFGKVDGGAAADTYYHGQAMFNKFKAKEKFSLYGTTATTGKVGLGWQDSQKYGSGGSVQLMDGGGIMISGGGGDELESFGGNYNGEGIPNANTGGVHYDSKWNDNKESININYKAGALTVDGNYDSQTQNPLKNGIQNNTSNQTFSNYIFRQKVDATYQVTLDSTSTLKLMVDGTLRNNSTNKNYINRNLRQDTSLQNSGDRTVDNKGEQQLFNANLLWTKKLKKTGRTLSINISEAFNQNENTGFLKTNNSFYSITEQLDSVVNVDQYKVNINRSNILGTNLTYTEPITKALSLVFNYGATLNVSNANRESYNKSVSGEYSLFDSEYSNNYDLNQLTNQVGAVFNYKKNKTIIIFGSRVANVNFDQKDVYTGKEYKRNFINLGPQASYQYRFSQQKSFNISYNGNTSQPGIDQIQPVRANTDPLNITIGNPDLKPSYSNRFNASYNSYKVLSEQYIYVNASYSFTTNSIIGNRTYNEGGGSVYQSVNLSDRIPANFSLSGSISRKIKFKDLNTGLRLSTRGGTGYNYIDGEINSTRFTNYNAGFTLSKYVAKKYNFDLSYGPNFSYNKSSLQPERNNNGGGSSGNFYFSLFLPKKLQIGGDANYEFRQKTQAFGEDFERFVINTRLSKAFRKDETLKLTLSGNDLLNQNTGFNRSAFSSSTHTTIRRYYLLSLSWDFNKMGAGAPPKTN